MATRPVFVPRPAGKRLVDEVDVDFRWHPGMAPVQKRKNVVELHEAARKKELYNLLEISSKSEVEIGRRLSAFSLKLDIDGTMTPLESVYQAAKVFEQCGPFPEIMHLDPRAAKKEIRSKSCGNLVAFELEGRRYPIAPKNAFYDWLYIRSLHPHREWIKKNVAFDGYTDIEFNPSVSVNCQARAMAEFLSLYDRGDLDEVAFDFEQFAAQLSSI